MKAKVRHIYEMIAGAILSLLGFSSIVGCGRLEYGSPYATFKVNGDVKAADTGKPIEGVVVKFFQDKTVPEWFYEFQSDKDGKVDELLTHLFPTEKGIMLTFEDVDGQEHGGLFAPDTLEAKDLTIRFVEDKKSGWHKGDYYVSFEAKLKKADKQ